MQVQSVGYQNHSPQECIGTSRIRIILSLFHKASPSRASHLNRGYAAVELTTDSLNAIIQPG